MFYTNTDSRKAQEIKQNNEVSLHFLVHIRTPSQSVWGGRPLSTAEVTRYFLSRPKEQLAAWASEQSRPIATVNCCLTVHEVKEKFKAEMCLCPVFGAVIV